MVKHHGNSEVLVLLALVVLILMALMARMALILMDLVLVVLVPAKIAVLFQQVQAGAVIQVAGLLAVTKVC